MLRAARRVDGRGDPEVPLYIDLICQCLVRTVDATSRGGCDGHRWWGHMADRVAACRDVVL